MTADWPETKAGLALLHLLEEAAPGAQFETNIAEVEEEARAEALREVGELERAIRDVITSGADALPAAMTALRRATWPTNREDECFCDSCWGYLLEDAR